LNEHAMTDASLYLASASPRRRELLSQLGLTFELVIPEVDETPLAGEMPADYVKRLAVAKALRGWEMTPRDNRLVLGADTCIAIDDHILGKPADEPEAMAMLARLSGRTHEVYSAVALIGTIEYNRLSKHTPGLAVLEAEALDAVVRVSASHVTFRCLTLQQCQAYWATGEPHDKAGAYAIQGRGAAFVQNLEGSYSGVVGLPLFETAELLQQHGIEILSQ
jgi:septum formation protein